jgi:chemotaxis protein methyltransferase CheR
MDALENQNLEIKLLLEAIFQKYGYDFRNYSMAHLKRRISRRQVLDGFASISEMVHRVIYDAVFFDRLLLDLSINVTEMFRDPTFFKAIREQVVTFLKTYPFIKVWVAGCSTGEEVYSLAILLQEEGIYDRAQIYATDFNQVVLEKARKGIYAVDRIKMYTANYQKSGGQRSFADYYSARYDSVLMAAALRERVVFADHNLVTDGVFGQMHMIICRNVIIYFDRQLQQKVVSLFMASLIDGGFLCMGQKESLSFSKYFDQLLLVNEKEKIFQKKYLPGDRDQSD